LDALVLIRAVGLSPQVRTRLGFSEIGRPFELGAQAILTTGLHLPGGQWPLLAMSVLHD